MGSLPLFEAGSLWDEVSLALLCHCDKKKAFLSFHRALELASEQTQLCGPGNLLARQALRNTGSLLMSALVF